MTTCVHCRGPIEWRSVGNDYFTGRPIMRWLRTDLIMAGCPATDSYRYCQPNSIGTWHR